jgi:cardiolipin synthase
MKSVKNTNVIDDVPPKLFSTPAEWFEALYDDIQRAKSMIYIEIYRINNDPVGRKVVQLLSEKCKQGLDVKVLVDSWGSKNDNDLFKPITDNKGEVRYFDKIKLSFDFISKNHLRNHRKIIIFDHNILHFGSANITEYSKTWRESILRVEGSIALTFKKILLDNWRIASLEFYKKRKYLKTIKIAGFEIVRDIPSIYNQKIKKQFERDIRRAKKSIAIVTPYFLPNYKLRRQLIMAAKKGVEVVVYIPQQSDVRLVDYIRDKYLGFLSSKKIQFLLFQPDNLHAKLLLIDQEYFSIGSSNFDYRSFRYMHEIMLFGKHPRIESLISAYIEDLKRDCLPFDFDQWKNRPALHKILGWLLTPFRHLL